MKIKNKNFQMHDNMKKQNDSETISINSDDIEIEMMKLDLKSSDRKCLNTNIFPAIACAGSLMFIVDWFFLKTGYGNVVALELIRVKLTSV